MKLQGRTLAPNLRGADVAQLQSELAQLNLETRIVDPAGFFGSTTFLAVQDFQRRHGVPMTGVVDEGTARLINRAVDAMPRDRWQVLGRVLRADGQAVPRARVRVFEKHLRREAPLGDAESDTRGSYDVGYPVPAEGRLSLVVRAFDANGRELAASAVICNADPIETVNLIADDAPFRGPSEFALLEEALAPVLRREQVEAADLTEGDATLLACQHDLDAVHLAYFIVSARLAREAHMRPEWFYGLVRQGLPTALLALVAEPSAVLQRALDASVQENIVGAALAGVIPDVLRGLQRQTVQFALRASEPDRPTFGALLDVASVPAAQRSRIVTRYLAHKGPIEDFWASMRQAPDVGDQTVDAIQDVVRLATLTLNHEPLVRELRQRPDVRADVRAVTRFTREDWERTIAREVQGRRIGAPSVLGGDEVNRPARYAAFLERMVEAIFPTAVLGHRLAERDAQTFAPTIAFLGRNPDFDFTAQRVHEYLREHPDAIEGDAERTTGQLRAVQRMMNIAPAFNKAAAVTLITHGIDSACAVRRMGAPQFLRAHAGRFDSAADAEQFYANAARQADTAVMVLSLSAVVSNTPLTITAPHLFGEGIADLEDLFGSLDTCQCESCASVYGPAAYLVDLLHFLMNRPATSGGGTALDVLFGDRADPGQRRRGDIGHIELTCQNSHTILPYVDLVNEILERAVSPGTEDSFQTLGDAETLAANPEHVNVAAYNRLAQAVYPWSLPFDLWMAEARAYLAHAGVSRHALMTTLPAVGPALAPVEIAAERLNLTPRERAIVTGAAPDPTHALWGMEAAEFERFLEDRRASTVLDRSGLSYEELTGVLAVQPVDPGGLMRVEFDGASCDLDRATVTGLTAARAGVLHRFVRLQQRLGWPTPELGALLAALGVSQLNDQALLLLADVKQVRDALRPAWEALVTWWSGRIETRTSNGKPSLFERVFSDPTINPPAVDVLALNAAGSELAQPNAAIGEHAGVVSSALGISTGDLGRLIAGELEDDRLNLNNLSRLFRIATFARALGLDIGDYLVLRGLTGLEPLGPGHAADARRFVELRDRVRDSGLDLGVLDYLLRHGSAMSSGVWTDTQIGAFLSDLRNALRQIAADRAFLPDPEGERTARTLPLILPVEAVNRTMAMLDGSGTENQASLAALIEQQLSSFLDPADAEAQLVQPGTLATPAQRFDYVLERLLAHLVRRESEALVAQSVTTAIGLALGVTEDLLRRLVASPADPQVAVLEDFLDPEFLADFDEDTIEPVTAFADQFTAFHRLSKIGIVLNTLSVPPESVEFVLTRGPQIGWLNVLALPVVTEALAGPALDQWLQQAAVFRAAAGFGTGIAGLLDLLATVNGPGQPSITRGEWLDDLTAYTGWSREDLEVLAGPDGFDLEFPGGFADGRFLVRLKACFALLVPLGVAARDAQRWTAPAVSADVARTIKQAMRARYQDQQRWLEVARPIRDPLREQQRAALVAHLVHAIRVRIPTAGLPHPLLALGSLGSAVREAQLKLNASETVAPLSVDGVFGRLTRAAVVAFQQARSLPADGAVGPQTWALLDQVRQRLRGPDDLYAHFLVDVEMDACMLTSRIVLATSSVQLFVQRCLLNLEPDVTLTPEDRKMWDWMKNFRVWEANRKVFLYPENWIEPELRDDKTPYFKELESGLLQDAITDATVERGYLAYLRQLAPVAQLEVAGVYRDWEPGGELLHVFGRTRSTPYVYHHRQWVNQRYWTPWRQIDLDIEGDHLVPIVWNRRLYLFWPMFMERAEETLPGDEEDAKEPRKYREVRLAWSEYRDAKWSAKEVSDGFIETGASLELPGTERYAFWAQVDAGRLSVQMGTHVDGTPEVVPALKGFAIVECSNSATPVSGLVTPIKIQTAFPRTSGRFNRLLEGGASTVFTAIVGGDTTPNPAFLVLSNIKTADVLTATPGQFRLSLPNVERPFVSQSPFFYQDDARSFVVVPSGGYSGGFGVGDLKLNLSTHDAVPLELPDSIVARTTVLVARGARALAGPVEIEPPVGEDAGGDSSRPETRNGVTAILDAPAAAHAALPMQWQARFFRFDNFYHPYVCLLIEQLNRHGVDGILRPDPDREAIPQRREVAGELRRQRLSKAFFNQVYRPNATNVTNVYGKPELSPQAKDAAGPRDEFDFSYEGAYSVYNWELFFHAPLMLAKRLGTNQRFAEAQRWLHFIFDPTDARADGSLENWPERVWQIKPFFEHGIGRSIERTMLLLKSSGLSAEERAERGRLRDQIEEWRKHPFNPHLLARLRPEAYMKSVVMAYLDNLIAWGDHLFRQDTMESINEATQLYLLASAILGDRPQEIAAHEGARPTIDGEPVSTFEQLRGHLDAFSNALVDLETVIYPMDSGTGGGGSVGSLLGATDFVQGSPGDGGLSPDLPAVAADIEPPDDGTLVLELPLAAPTPAILGPSLFFCIPKNDKLLTYWDTVADRLFKIRHCMNIAGVERQLALFAPPIDPGLLVKAAAAGVDIGSVLNDLNAPAPGYRFQIMVQKAHDLIADAKGLGAALLAALEKKDAEVLAVLRSGQEIQVMAAVRDVKLRQIEEAASSKVALEASLPVLESRALFYETRIPRSDKEQQHLDNLEDANAFQGRSSTTEVLRAAFGYLPDFDIGLEGFGSSPTIKARWGSSNILSYMGAISQGYAYDALQLSHDATKALTEGGYERRQEEWDFQAAQARAEIEQVNKQIAAVDVRIQIGQADLAAHDRQVESAKVVDDYMRGKYSNADLYAWMISQITAVYFQSYQLAYEAAKRAESVFQRELAVTGADFIQFGHWDALKKGLLAAERLQQDVRRMEVAYLDQNTRELELTKHVSLRQLNPLALLTLKATGACQVTIPEWLFDLDGPGHYLRRVKSVSLTVPCVVGPYAGVHCTLSLHRSTVRVSSQLLDGQYTRQAADPRFVDSFGSIQQVVTSSGTDDSGLFETSLRDERFLPFEGSGAEGTWTLQLPNGFRQFDYDSISDVILHMRYTARSGGVALRDAAASRLESIFGAVNEAGPRTLLSLPHDYPTEWHRFVSGTEPLRVPLNRIHFPYLAQGREIRIHAMDLLTVTDAPPLGVALSPGQLGLAVFPVFSPQQHADVALVFEDDAALLPRSTTDDVFLLMHFTMG